MACVGRLSLRVPSLHEQRRSLRVRGDSREACTRKADRQVGRLVRRWAIRFLPISPWVLGKEFRASRVDSIVPSAITTTPLAGTWMSPWLVWTTETRFPARVRRETWQSGATMNRLLASLPPDSCAARRAARINPGRELNLLGGK